LFSLLDRFAMTIQTVYCVDEAKIQPQHEKLLRVIRSLKGLTKGKVKTIDIGTAPKTSDGSMYDNVYVKGKSVLFCKIIFC
jgi:hypothetical protein